MLHRYPVLVDPQGQGRLWLMNREEANQLKVTQLNDKMFRNHLEDCLAFGKVGYIWPTARATCTGVVRAQKRPSAQHLCSWCSHTAARQCWMCFALC